jgi:hypothetical protein
MMSLPHCHLAHGDLSLRDGILYVGDFVAARVERDALFSTRRLEARMVRWLDELEVDAADALGRYARRCPFCGRRAVDRTDKPCAPAPDAQCSMRYADWADWVRLVQTHKTRLERVNKWCGRAA